MPSNPSPATVLCIGGHDPSGGAGIIADAEAVRAAGAHAVTVITALTEQDTARLRRLYPQPPEQIEAQCQAMLADARPRAIKIGLVGSSRVARAIAAVIDSAPDIPVILDPILATGAGQSVADAALLNQLRQHLVSRASLVTPNLPEARELTDATDGDSCARRLLERGARWVLVTGTHDGTEAVVNRLYRLGAETRAWSWPRLPGEFHGSGCTLASAIAARIAIGLGMPEAVAEAQDYTWTSLARARRTGAGQLTPDRLHALNPEPQPAPAQAP